MAEQCRLVSGEKFETDQNGFVVGTDIPRACIWCLYRARHGDEAEHALEVSESLDATSPERLKSKWGIKVISGNRNRRSFNDFGSRRDSQQFDCERVDRLPFTDD